MKIHLSCTWRLPFPDPLLLLLCYQAVPRLVSKLCRSMRMPATVILMPKIRIHGNNSWYVLIPFISRLSLEASTLFWKLGLPSF